jgi:hypothetical protein
VSPVRQPYAGPFDPTVLRPAARPWPPSRPQAAGGRRPPDRGRDLPPVAASRTDNLIARHDSGRRRPGPFYRARPLSVPQPGWGGPAAAAAAAAASSAAAFGAGDGHRHSSAKSSWVSWRSQ